MKKQEFDQFITKIGDLGMKELSEVRTAADQRIQEVRAEEAEKVQAKVREVIEQGGFNADDFLKGRGNIGPKNPKFQDPNNKTLVWGGRGKKPGWLQKAIEAGSKLEDFRVVEQHGQKAA